MPRIIQTLSALGFAATLAFMPACDKGEGEGKAKDDKSAKGEHAKGEHAKGEHGEHTKGEPGSSAAEVAQVEAGGRVEIEVDAAGYHPAQIEAPASSKVTLAFKRVTEAGCGQKLVLEAMEVEKDLPLNEVVEIEVVVPASGELGFACGMDMYKGKVVPKA